MSEELTTKSQIQRPPAGTMIPPSAGFVERVMARIEERKRAQARQRAWIGAGLLVAGAGVLIALSILTAGGWIVQWLPLDSYGSLAAFLAVSLIETSALIQAIVVALLAVSGQLNQLQVLAYALFVFALSMLWARVASGTPKFSPAGVAGSSDPQKILGGSR